MVCVGCGSVIESHWFVWVTQANHIPMEIDFDQERPWFTSQVSGYKDDLLAFCAVCDDSFNIALVDPKSVSESDRGK